MTALPFFTVEKAWFWAIAVDSLKQAPKSRVPHWAKVERPCDYTDILREVGRLGLSAKEREVLRRYGQSGRVPTSDDHPEDQRMWDAAMDRLRTALTRKGIVVRGVDLLEA